jgi:hypothetical protein
MKKQSIFAKSLMIAGIFTLGLALQAPAAEAGHKNRRDHHEKRYKHSQYSKHNKHNKHDQRSHRYKHSGHDRYKKVERYQTRYSGPSYSYRTDRRHNRFVVPTYISASRAYDYQSYFHSESYYRPHGHIHQVYRFPVYDGYGMDYRAVTYCNGSHYRTGRFVYDGPKFGFSIQF